MINEYFKLIWHIKIENLVLEVLDRLREYERIQRTVKKAEIFSKEDITGMLEKVYCYESIYGRWESYLFQRQHMLS